LPLGALPSSLHSPIPDLHFTHSDCLTLYLPPWGAPFQPPFSDHRSALTHSLCQRPWGAPFQLPFSDSRSALHSLTLSTPLGRYLPASILRSPICTRSLSPLGALPSSLHSPIPDLHSLTALQTTEYTRLTLALGRYLPASTLRSPFSDLQPTTAVR